jgi:hypothetical protein
MNTLIKSTTLRLSKVLGAMVLGGLLASCATMSAQKAKDTEQLLVAAGFKMTLADTPAKMAHLKTLTQNKIVPHKKDGVAYYVYADATNCQCFYWGQAQAYQKFQQLQVQQNLAAEDRLSAEMDADEELNWDTMGYGMGEAGMGFY